MKIRHYVLIGIIFVVALFVAANWQIITVTSELNLLVRTIEAPLGLVLCGAIFLLGIVFLVILAHVETSAALEGRNRIKELDRLRKIAEKKEASRIHDLELRIESRFEDLFAVLDQVVTVKSLEETRDAVRDDFEERDSHVEDEDN